MITQLLKEYLAKISIHYRCIMNGKDRKCAAWRLEGFHISMVPLPNQMSGMAHHHRRDGLWMGFLESDAGITSAI